MAVPLVTLPVGLIVSRNTLLSVALNESVTLTVKVQVCGSTGVPDATPDEDSPNPTQIVPPVMAQVYGVEPLTAYRVWEYVIPAGPPGNGDREPMASVLDEGPDIEDRPRNALI